MLRPYILIHHVVCQRFILDQLPREGRSSYKELGGLDLSYPSSIASTAFMPVQADVSSAHPTSEG